MPDSSSPRLGRRFYRLSANRHGGQHFALATLPISSAEFVSTVTAFGDPLMVGAAQSLT
jgi:hypothetical protein